MHRGKSSRPLIAFAMGDAAGIGGELMAKILDDAEVRAEADILLIGDRRVLNSGRDLVGGSTSVLDLDASAPEWNGREPTLLDLHHLDPDDIRAGEASAAGGAFALRNFSIALRLAAAGGADAVCFTPFNKYAMRLAEPDYVDEIGFIKRETGSESDGSEFNVLEEVWNARVTSHVPLGDVASHITGERVLRAIELTESTMRGAGIERPRIGVAGLNPHAGDGGNFGREEIEVIAPAVEEAKLRQLAVDGPIPSDTVYVRALKGEFDAVLTMYHDQGQIAMKLIGFDRGVTLIGGYPFWITTPAHGTAYDIAGKGVASPNATREALLLASRLARRTSPEGFADPSSRLSVLPDIVAERRWAA